MDTWLIGVVFGILVLCIFVVFKKIKPKETFSVHEQGVSARDYTLEQNLHKIYIETQTQNEYYKEFGSYDRQKARNSSEKQKELEQVLIERYKYFLPNVVITRKSMVYKRHKESVAHLKGIKGNVRRMNKQKNPPSNSPAHQRYLNEYLMLRKSMNELEKKIELQQLEHLILYLVYTGIELH